MPGLDRRRGAAARLAWLGLGVLVLLATAVLLPLRPPRFPSHPQPIRDTDEAIARLAALGNDDTCTIAPECRTILRLHGPRTPHVVVLFHGLTNCPAQFDSLGRELYAHGANVVIPVIPHHGCADPMTEALARLNARELVTFTDHVIDAASALGDSVTVVGLSLGAVLAAWADQERSDVTRAVVIAPMFGIALAPGPFTNALSRAYRHLPNRFEWWDPRVREKLPGPTHVYPRWSWRSIGETLWLGASVQEEARHRAPAGRSIAMVLVGGDLAIDNRRAREVAALWSGHGAAVDTYVFPDSLHLNHDIIDPDQAGADPPLVYPRLVERILPGAGATVANPGMGGAAISSPPRSTSGSSRR